MKILLFPLLTCLITLASCSISTNKQLESKEMVLWYNKPADKVWLDGLFVGNGYMGANVFGKVLNERIALNESTFWSGRPHDYNDPDAYKYFGQIKDLVFAGKFKEAEKLADEHFYGKPAAQQAYQPIGNLLIDFKVTGYGNRHCEGKLH
jgi:alpha-L-fucosidase 2